VVGFGAGEGVAAVVSGEAEGERRRRFPRSVGWTLAAFAAASVLFSGAFPPFANPNELSRYESVVAAWDRGTFAIDDVIPILGDHEDKSVSAGKTYSNKAPGLAFAALPVYALLRTALPSPESPAALILWILRVLTVTLVCAFALARLARRLEAGHRPVWRETAPLVVAAVALGTPYLFFARSFFAHAWTAALLFLSWDALVAGEDAGRRKASEAAASETADGRRRRGAALLAALAGFLAGWAAISEYTVAPVAGLLALRAALGPGRRRIPGLLAFIVGAAIPLAKLAFYDAMCFGSPWVLSSAREAYPSYSRLAGSGIFGFGLPSPRVALDYLFHPARGLVLFSPFLIWAVPGFVRWWRSSAGDGDGRGGGGGRSRADCAFALAATAVFFVLMCGYPNWHGGWSLGNRYLVPVLFFPALAIPYALESPRSRGFFGAAVVLSAATHLLLTASWPYFPDNIPWPAATGSGWFLARGWTAPSLLDALRGGGWAALAMTWTAAAVAIALALRAAESPSPGPPMGAVALLGLLPLLALVVFAPDLDFGGRLWRSSIFGAYSGRDPERRELREVARSAATPQQQRMAMGAWRIYGPR
jgi:hypothetical protein